MDKATMVQGFPGKTGAALTISERLFEALYAQNRAKNALSRLDAAVRGPRPESIEADGRPPQNIAELAEVMMQWGGEIERRIEEIISTVGEQH